MKLIMSILICCPSTGLNSMEQVHLEYWFPDLNTLWEDLGIQYIDRGLTYPKVDRSRSDGVFEMAVTANHLTITMHVDWHFSDQEFNGWVLTAVTGGLDFSDAKILQSSAPTSLIRLTSTTDVISVNWGGTPFVANDVLVIGFKYSDVSE